MITVTITITIAITILIMIIMSSLGRMTDFFWALPACQRFNLRAGGLESAVPSRAGAEMLWSYRCLRMQLYIGFGVVELSGG